MRAIVVQRLGPPEVLELGEVPVPEPGPGQVLVRLHAAGVNFSDTERRRGIYAGLALPWIPGTEGAGRVVAAGPGVEPALLDRRVAFWAMPPAVSGTYAEYAAAPASSLFLLGPDTPFDLGAAFPQQGLTAYGLVFFATVIHPGATVLIHAAAGGVGQILVQLEVGGRQDREAVQAHPEAEPLLAWPPVSRPGELDGKGSAGGEVRGASSRRPQHERATSCTSRRSASRPP